MYSDEFVSFFSTDDSEEYLFLWTSVEWELESWTFEEFMDG